MTRTIGEQVRENAARTFVGRGAELTALRAAVDDPDILLAHVHGPGGIGKSRLLRAALAELPASTAVTLLDGRDVEPTPRGVHQALRTALGLPVASLAPTLGLPGAGGIGDVGGTGGTGDADPREVVEALAAARRHVLAVDTYEVLGLIDTWLRTTLLPALPASVVTVLVGRDRPATAWHCTPGWTGSVRELCLGPLTAQDAHELLRARGLDEDRARRADDFARGHPLALELAAATVEAGTSSVTAGGPVPDGLLDAFVAGLPPAEVIALEAAATTRRITEPLLRAVLDEPDPDTDTHTGEDRARSAFDGLRRLPFVESSADGLLLHDVVRDTVGHELAVRDPERRRRYRRRATRFLAARPPARDDLWQRTADLMFLIENPVVRDACFPSTRPAHVVEPARPEDAAEIAEIAGKHEPPAVADALARWWSRHPETFAVAREPDGSVAAFVQIAELGAIDPTLLDSDPVAAPWLGHLAAQPPGGDERVLLMRRWLGRVSGELRSPPVSACWLDVKRTYMQWRPRLRRLYSTVVDLPQLGPIFLPLGFAPTGPGVDVDGTTYQPVWLDFGPHSVDGWLAGLVDSETGTGPVAGTNAGPAGACDLSAREREVLTLLADGLSNREIGARLFVSEKTAGRHVSNIFTKLEVHTRARAVRVAAERGWLGA